jgi:hypothetical protein
VLIWIACYSTPICIGTYSAGVGVATERGLSRSGGLAASIQHSAFQQLARIESKVSNSIHLHANIFQD